MMNSGVPPKNKLSLFYGEGISHPMTTFYYPLLGANPSSYV
jgi:hypothetical protein